MNELCDRLAETFAALTDDSVGGERTAGSRPASGSPQPGRNRVVNSPSRSPVGIDRDALLSHARSCPRCQPIALSLTTIEDAPRSSRATSSEPPARLWATIEASLRTEGLIRDSR